VIESLPSQVPIDLDEVDRLMYFDAVYAGFARAIQKTGSVIERFYSIGGSPSACVLPVTVSFHN
jgi:hypothetical protein